jgi:SAM-dependent methyltransferase
VALAPTVSTVRPTDDGMNRDQVPQRRMTRPTGDHPIARRLFRLVRRSTVYDHEPAVAYRLRSAATREFLRRFEGNLAYSDATVLDYGCGLGSTCMELIRTGAAEVVGVDIDPARIAFARSRLLEHCPELADRVDFRVIRGVEDIEDGGFDLILSQDTFQVVREPEGTVMKLVERLGPRGELAIGISPLWNAPSGGLVDDVSWLP